jgi:hypothetical protein
MNRVVGIVLIVIGGWLIYTGYRQADSLAGRTKTTLVDVKNSIDGKGRVARQYWYYGGGALLVVAGAAIGLRKRA